MAGPVEYELTADADDLLGSLDAVDRKLGDVEGKTESGQSSWGNYSQKITAATVAIQAGYAAAVKLFEGLKEVAAEFERQASIINRFTGNIDNASARINGLISNLDLMVAQQKLAAAGIETTAEEFGNLAVAANESAGALGTSASEALVKLTDQLITGGEELVRFGVDLTGTTDKAGKTEAAITQLSERFRGAESNADTLAGRLGVLEVELDNIETSMIETINASDIMERSLSDLADTLDRLTGSGQQAGLSIGEALGAVVAGAVTTAANQARYLALALEALLDGRIGDAADMAARAVEEGGRIVGNVEAAAGEAIRDRVAGQIERSGRQVAPLPEPEPEPEPEPRPRPLPVPVAGTDTDAEAELRRIDALKERMGALAEAEQQWGIEARERELARLDAIKEHEGALLDSLEAEKRARNEMYLDDDHARQRQLDAKLEAAEREREAAVTTATDITGASIQAGDMLLEAFGATQGQKELWQGISDVAMGVTKIAAYDYVSAAVYGISAGLHFANAAQMGVGGGAAPAVPSGAAPSSRPQTSGDGGGGGGGVVSYTINYNSAVAEPLIGREQRRAERSARRRFGAAA